MQLAGLEAFLRQRGYEVDTAHLYLPLADRIGVQDYNFFAEKLYIGEVLYAPFLYPEHYEAKSEEVREYLNQIYRKNFKSGPGFTPENLQSFFDKIQLFHQDILTQIDFAQYGLVGFTINYSQLVPSLVVAREIKKRWPDVQIVFGGSGVTGELGLSTLRAFSWVDHVISGEGELALQALIDRLQNGAPTEIPGLITRENGEVKYYPERNDVSLSELPVPNFDSYYRQLDRSSTPVKQFVYNSIKLPVEFSRGCWWNRCAFCNLNLVHKKYKLKKVDQVVQEMVQQSEKCQELEFIFLDNSSNLPQYKEMLKNLNSAGYRFKLSLEMNAGGLTKEDVQALAEGGVVAVQLGIESFSRSLLKKMNKKVSVIHNIESIKLCEEAGIYPVYNILCSMPNEEKAELEETFANIELIKHLIPPSGISPFGLGYDSPIFKNYAAYNIKAIKPHISTTLIFPEDVLENLLPFRYDFELATPYDFDSDLWYEKILAWMDYHKKLQGKKGLYYRDGKTFIIVYDKRRGQLEKSKLTGLHRELLLFLDTIQNMEGICTRFSQYAKTEITAALNELVARRLVFCEEEQYLSLVVQD